MLISCELQAVALAYIILAMFFARLTHRNAIDPTTEAATNCSYHDTVYRGEGEIDLWMMGEGSHHLHHAKSDISYCRLAQVLLPPYITMR